MVGLAMWVLGWELFRPCLEETEDWPSSHSVAVSNLGRYSIFSRLLLCETSNICSALFPYCELLRPAIHHVWVEAHRIAGAIRFCDPIFASLITS